MAALFALGDYVSAESVGADSKNYLDLDAHGLGLSSHGQGTPCDGDQAAKASTDPDCLDGFPSPAVLAATGFYPLTYAVSITDLDDLSSPPSFLTHSLTHSHIGGLQAGASAASNAMATAAGTVSAGMVASGKVHRSSSRRRERRAKRARQAPPSPDRASRRNQRQRTGGGPVELCAGARGPDLGVVLCLGCNKERDVAKLYPHQQSHLPRSQQTNVCDACKKYFQRNNQHQHPYSARMTRLRALDMRVSR